MYVINPASAPQDLPNTFKKGPASTGSAGTVTESILVPRTNNEILTQLLTKCTAEMSKEAANFSSPRDKTPPPSAAIALTSPIPATVATPPSQASPATSPRGTQHSEEGGPTTRRPDDNDSQVEVNGIADPCSSSASGTLSPTRMPDVSAKVSLSDKHRTTCSTVAPKASPLSSNHPASASNSEGSAAPTVGKTTSSSPSSSGQPSDSVVPHGEAPTANTATTTLAPATFSSVVHPKERALRSIAVGANGGSPTAEKGIGPSVKVANGKASGSVGSPGAGAILRGTANSNCVGGAGSSGVTAAAGCGSVHGGRLQFFKGKSIAAIRVSIGVGSYFRNHFIFHLISHHCVRCIQRKHITRDDVLGRFSVCRHSD